MRKAEYSSRNNPKPTFVAKLKVFLGDRRLVAILMVLVTLSVYGYLRMTAPTAQIDPAILPANIQPAAPQKEDPYNYEGTGRTRQEISAGILQMEVCKEELKQYCNNEWTDFDGNFECLDRVRDNLQEPCQNALRGYWKERLLREGRAPSVNP